MMDVVLPDPDHMQRKMIKFVRARKQMNILKKYESELECRYDKAARDNLRKWRYNLRLRLCVSEGVRNAYYEYTRKLATEILQMIFSLGEFMGLPLNLQVIASGLEEYLAAQDMDDSEDDKNDSDDDINDSDDDINDSDDDINHSEDDINDLDDDMNNSGQSVEDSDENMENRS